MASIPELREIDAAASGVDRSVDHEYYLPASGRRGWLFRRAGRPVAYVMVRPDGWVGPAASVRARRHRASATAFADRCARGAKAREKVRAGVTGRCEGAQRAFWEAGLVFDGHARPAPRLPAVRPAGPLRPASYGLF